MDFSQTREERALVEALGKILASVCSTQRLRAWEAGNVSMDDAFARAIAAGGFLEAGLPFGEAPSFSLLVQLEEEAGKFLAPPVLSWIAGYAAFLASDQPLARRLAAGEILSVAPPGRARLDIHDERLTGQASGLLFADRAQQLLVVLGSRLALVETRRVSLQPVAMQSGVPHWRGQLENAEAEWISVPTERLALAHDRLRVCQAAWSAGAGRKAIGLAVAYACEREAFDHKIGSYQSVQNRLVDAAIQIEEARLLAYRAASVIEGGEPTPLAPLARHLAGNAFAQATRAAMLTFGGYSFTVDFDIQLYFRRAKEAQLDFEPRVRWDRGELPPPFRGEAA